MGSDPEQFMANLSMAIERLVIEKYKKNYPTELELKKEGSSNTKASFLDKIVSLMLNSFAKKQDIECSFTLQVDKLLRLMCKQRSENALMKTLLNNIFGHCFSVNLNHFQFINFFYNTFF